MSKVQVKQFEHPAIIAVINLSGNQGKSTIVNCLIAPRCYHLQNVFYVESTNAIPSQIESPIGVVIDAGDFNVVETAAIIGCADGKSIVVDFGASDINLTKSLIQQYSHFINSVDCFVIPVSAGFKEIKDTIETIEFLLNEGVTAEKIKVIFNKVPFRDQKNIKTTFDSLFKLKEKISGIGIDESFSIGDLEVFKRLGAYSPALNFNEIQGDNTDYQSALKKPDLDADTKKAIATLFSTAGLVNNAVDYFNKASKAIFTEFN